MGYYPHSALSEEVNAAGSLEGLVAMRSYPKPYASFLSRTDPVPRQLQHHFLREPRLSGSDARVPSGEWKSCETLVHLPTGKGERLRNT